MYDRRPTTPSAARRPHLHPRGTLLLLLSLLGGVLFGQHLPAVEAALQEGGMAIRYSSGVTTIMPPMRLSNRRA